MARTLMVMPTLLLLLLNGMAAHAATLACTYTNSASTFLVSWEKTDVYKYIVERSVDNSRWYWRGAVLETGQQTYQFQDNGVTADPGSAIRYRLRTKAIDNSSPLQEPVTCTFKDIERPGRATSVETIALSATSIKLSWQAALDNVAVQRYAIYRAPVNGAPAAKVGESTELSFIDTGLNPSTEYWYYLRAIDTSGNIGWRTGYRSGATLATPACSVVETAEHQFEVSWRDTNVYKYIVERSVNSGPWSWRGARRDNNRDLYLFSDAGSAPEQASIVYRLQTKALDNSSPKQDPVVCEQIETPSSVKSFITKLVDGRWEIFDTNTSEVVYWNAVNVRSDKFQGANPRLLDNADIKALSMVFNAIRLSIHWDQLHTGPNQYNDKLRDHLENLLDLAAKNQVDVILDPVHLGSKRNNFWMPDWLLADDLSNHFELLHSDEINQYLDWIMGDSGLGQHPAVVAVEVVNEPHPEGSVEAWKYEKQRDLMVAYQRMVDTIRNQRPEIIVVLGAYYGGHLFDNGLADGNAIADIFTGTPNLVWTAHNYFTGLEPQRVGPDYNNDGLADIDGQGYRGVRGAGIWTESYDSAGCYAQNPPYDASQCDATLPLRHIALQGHANNAANHDRVAQQAGMPFFMGEFGMGRLRDNGRIGWGGTQAFMCDKLQAYSNLHLDGRNKAISWAVWAFDSRVDGGFGLYNPDTDQWIPETSDAFFGDCP